MIESKDFILASGDGSSNERKADYTLLVRLTPPGNVLWHPTLDLMIGALVRLIGRHRRGFAGGLAATLPAKVAILFLCGRNQPKTATRIT